MKTTSYQETVEAARNDGGRVLVERDGGRAVVTMNDPEKLNPLSAALTPWLAAA